jgi:hypothetical protein
MRISRRWLLGAALSGILVCAAGSYAVLSEEVRFAVTPAHIEVRATAIDSFDNRDPTKVRFGALEFRGGLVLTSSNRNFGGISAFHMEPDGSHFTAATDNGSWLRGTIVYRDGRPDAIADAEIAPILSSSGKPIAARGWFDVESLAEFGGKFYIGIERAEQILRFDLRRDGLLALGEPITVPPDFKTFAFNKSLECLTGAPETSALAGNLIVVTEQSLDGAGNHRSFLLKGDAVGRFSVKRSDDFDVTDCTILPPGDLLIVERRYSPARGVAMRIRRIPLAAIKEGATVDGQILIDVDLAYQIDNMEGIAVHRNAAGETIITLVSDDNFSVIQRNLLLQFVLVGE